MNYIRENRLLSLLIVFVIYTAAFFVALVVFNITDGQNILLRLALADVAATIVVWFFGVVLNNSSVYDPYWSIAPVVIIPLMVIRFNAFNEGTALLMLAVLFWGIRLTVNWIYTFENLNWQDWRYTKLKKGNPKVWFFVNLFGINLFPTAVVFVAIIPAVLFIQNFSQFNIGILLGGFVCVAATTLQLVSDIQMHRFKKRAAGGINDCGIWKYSRHPNYLGEILMWCGVFIMLVSVSFDFWFMAFAPMINNIMFMVISIPMMENRQLCSKPEYADYIKKTGKLLPKLFNRG